MEMRPMNDMNVIRIHVEILRQHIFGFISHHASRTNPVNVNNTSKFTKPGTAELGQNEMCVVLQIHGRTITATINNLCDPKHKFSLAIICSK